MRFGILVFPGTWSDKDCYYQVKDILGQDADYVWHDETSLDGFDSVILPGGFSYGDYLRPGAMARFSPVMEALNKFVTTGRAAFASLDYCLELYSQIKIWSIAANQPICALSVPIRSSPRYAVKGNYLMSRFPMVRVIILPMVKR